MLWLQELLLIRDQMYLQVNQLLLSLSCAIFSMQFLTHQLFVAALWWSRYGGDCPELQRLAVRILSQTCDGASKFQLRRCLAEALLLSNGKNVVTDKKWQNDMLFLRYNMQLHSFGPGKTNYVACDEIDPVDDWVADVAGASPTSMDLLVLM